MVFDSNSENFCLFMMVYIFLKKNNKLKHIFSLKDISAEMLVFLNYTAEIEFDYTFIKNSKNRSSRIQYLSYIHPCTNAPKLFFNIVTKENINV